MDMNFNNSVIFDNLKFNISVTCGLNEFGIHGVIDEEAWLNWLIKDFLVSSAVLSSVTDHNK